MLRSLGFGPLRRSRARFLLPGVAIWTDFEFFQNLVKAGDIYHSTTIPDYCDGPYIHLGVYVNEVPSAWTEVWSGSYRSRARFWLPGVAIWADFEIFEILGGAGNIYNLISTPNYYYPCLP